MIIASLFFLAQSIEENKSENLEKKEIDITTNISIEELQDLLPPNNKDGKMEMRGQIKIITIDENGKQTIQEYDLNDFQNNTAPPNSKGETRHNDISRLMQAQINELRQMLRNPDQSLRGLPLLGESFRIPTDPKLDMWNMRSKEHDMMKMFDMMMEDRMHESKEHDMMKMFDMMMEDRMHESKEHDMMKMLDMMMEDSMHESRDLGHSEFFGREMVEAIDSIHERLDHQENMLMERLDSLENMFEAIDSIHERLNDLEEMLRKIEEDVDRIKEYAENLD